MKQIHLHKEAGIRIHDDATEETVYLDTLEQAGQDAQITLNWPDPFIIRIFPLEDGRIAIVRETAAGLSQEAASPAMVALANTFAEKAEQMVQQQQARLEASATDEGAT